MILSKAKVACILVLAVGFAGAKDAVQPRPIRPNPKIPAQETVAQSLLDKLNQEINYEGVDDVRASLSDVLDQISKRYNLTFEFNEKEFDIDTLEVIKRTLIADPRPIPPLQRTTLSTVLQLILRRVPFDNRLIYLIHPDRIEITTEEKVCTEWGIISKKTPEGSLSPPLCLVGITLRNEPIAEALPRLARQLARQSEFNIVVDPRIAEKLQARATVECYNVPVATAVRLLANIAGGKMVQLDNVFYVTTEKNAKQLQEERMQINADSDTP